MIRIFVDKFYPLESDQDSGGDTGMATGKRKFEVKEVDNFDFKKALIDNPHAFNFEKDIPTHEDEDEECSAVSDEMYDDERSILI